GKFGFKYVAGVLLGMMMLVGPIDWFLLKKMGRQPWTWVTTLGWIGLITTGALFMGSLFRSGDLHLRTLRVIEQVDDAVVAKTDVVGIYSPRTTEYMLTTPPGSWWEPISTDQYSYGSRGMMQAVPFRQDGRDNRPEEMTINVWNLRFLTGETVEKSEPVLGADLTWKIEPFASGGGLPTPHMVMKGTVTNLGDAPLRHLWLRTGVGLYDLTLQNGVSGGAVAPKATVQVNVVFVPNAEWGKDQAEMLVDRYGRQRRNVAGGGLALAKTAGNLSPARTARIEEMLEQSGGATPGNFGQRESGARAVLYATSEDIAPAVTLRNEKPIEKHWQVIRAVVGVKDGSKQATTQKADVR
ncbi:MAG: hypothetical protein JWO37_4126, partial [Acidimicrobiales bacterium]|nr:hypothetical protein [Acidimicrobiales bacterium]